jgi:glycosyltransferase involved in cell wall biosynthesis
MKIGLINFTYNKKSGIETVADSILRQIITIDSENKYLLFVNEAAKDYYVSSVRIEKKVIKMAGGQLFKILWLLLIYPFYSLAKRIDITIIFNCSSNFSLSPFTKNIIYIHDLGELSVENKYDIKRMIYRKYLSLPINKLFGDVFIVVSEFTRREVIEKLKIAAEKVRLIYNGTNETVIKLNRDAARQKIIDKYKINGSDKILITIGRIDPVGKNLIKLIEAVDILKKTDTKFHLFLVGESNFPNSHLVPEEIEKRNLSRFVTLSGYVDADGLNLFYNAADLLIFPSIYEGFGLPILEAMKCELPVACADIEVFHEVGNEAVIYFNPFSPDDMAKQVTLALSDNSLRAGLIERGKHRQSIFSWDNSARKLLKIIDSLKPE